jgi:hypothetical protein
VLGTRCFVLQVQRSSRDAFALPFHEETALLGVRKIPFLEVSPGDKRVFESPHRCKDYEGRVQTSRVIDPIAFSLMLDRLVKS